MIYIWKSTAKQTNVSIPYNQHVIGWTLKTWISVDVNYQKYPHIKEQQGIEKQDSQWTRAHRSSEHQ